MLNKDLINPKDLKIAKLRKAIKDFQEYDAERKLYYSEALQKLGELQSYVEELEDTDKCTRKLKELESQNKGLNKKIAELKAIILCNDIKIPSDLDKCLLIKENFDLKEANKALMKNNSKLGKTNKELVNKVCELINKLEKYEKVFN